MENFSVSRGDIIVLLIEWRWGFSDQKQKQRQRSPTLEWLCELLRRVLRSENFNQLFISLLGEQHFLSSTSTATDKKYFYFHWQQQRAAEHEERRPNFSIFYVSSVVTEIYYNQNRTIFSRVLSPSNTKLSLEVRRRRETPQNCCTYLKLY